jgi:hypothetical protein
VNRYVFASDVWVGKTSDLPAGDDPERGNCVFVIAVERNGFRRFDFAEITRNGGAATLGPWNANGDVPQGWLFELLDEGYSERTPRTESPPVGRLSPSDLQDQHPEQAAEVGHSFEIHTQLGDLMDQLTNGGDGDPKAMYMALESVLRSIVKEMGSPKGIGEFARFLRDYPDKFPMFPVVPPEVPSVRQVRVCTEALRRFNSEQRKAGHTPSAMFGAFINMYLYVAAQAIGALQLADRIENWDPEHQAKLRELGLRSSFELDDDEGHVFLAPLAGSIPHWCNRAAQC